MKIKILLPYQIICLLMLVLLMTAGCKKNGTLEPVAPNPNPVESETIHKNFFTRHASTDALVVSVQQFVKNQNRQFHFIDKLVAAVGYPVWDKSMVYRNARGAASPNAADDSTVIFVPFARENESAVDAALAVRIKKNDTAFRMIYAWQYKEFDESAKGWNSIDIFQTFSVLNNRVFGTTEFAIKDSRLVPESVLRKLQNARLDFDSVDFVYTLTKNAAENLSTIYEVEVCNTYTFCVKKLKPFRTESDDCQQIGSLTVCKTYFFEVAEDDDPGNPGSGGGGGGGGGGGSSPWNIPPDPCPVPPPGVPATQFCDDNGWEPLNPATEIHGFYFDRLAELQQAINNDKFFLIDPCQQLDNWRQLGVFAAPPVVTNRIAQLNTQFSNVYAPYYSNPAAGDPFVIQNINDAYGTVLNCDYFPIHITLLPIVNNQPFSQEDLFDYFRKNINSLLDNSIATFTPYLHPDLVDDGPLWNSPNPVSTLLHLNMTNDGTVIVTDYQTNPQHAFFRVTTVRSPMDGLHPVSGNREWGIREDTQHGGFTFYTMAVDRISNFGFNLANGVAEVLPLVNSGFDDADQLWRSLQTKMIQFIESHGGHASLYPPPSDLPFRIPDWLLIRYLRKQMTFEEFKHSLGCP